MVQTKQKELQQVFQYIDENKDKYMEWLCELCEIPSVAAHSRGIPEAVQSVSNRLSEIGAEIQVIPTPGNPVVFGQLPSIECAKTLSFYNHYDVQPEDPIEKWESPPFTPTIRDGKIFCRGVADNKDLLWLEFVQSTHIKK
ncbi:M20/M25/M40 family metallo-hydrolase [Sporosarcina sp. ITBMC105]